MDQSVGDNMPPDGALQVITVVMVDGWMGRAQWFSNILKNH